MNFEMEHQIDYHYFMKKGNTVYVTFIEDKGNVIDCFNDTDIENDFQKFKKACELYR